MSPLNLPDNLVLLITDDNVGFGTAVSNLDVLVCIEKTARNINHIRYEYQNQSGIVDVLYTDEENNIAFCTKPEFLHGVILKNSCQDHFNKDTFYSQFKLQGEPVITDGNLCGLISYPIIQSENTNFIPADIIFNVYQEWKQSGISKGIKCPECSTINGNQGSSFQCFNCNFQLRYDNSSTYPAPILVRIEKIISSTGFNPEYARRGSGIWCLKNESISLELNYHQRTGSFLAQIKIGYITPDNKDKILSYLMKQNFLNKEMALSIKDDTVYLLLTLFDDYLDDHATKNALIKMLKFGKNYKEVIDSLI